jgi:hypothetical protein
MTRSNLSTVWELGLSTPRRSLRLSAGWAWTSSSKIEDLNGTVDLESVPGQ